MCVEGWHHGLQALFLNPGASWRILEESERISILSWGESIFYWLGGNVFTDWSECIPPTILKGNNWCGDTKTNAVVIQQNGFTKNQKIHIVFITTVRLL